MFGISQIFNLLLGNLFRPGRLISGKHSRDLPTVFDQTDIDNPFIGQVVWEFIRGFVSL